MQTSFLTFSKTTAILSLNWGDSMVRSNLAASRAIRAKNERRSKKWIWKNQENLSCFGIFEILSFKSSAHLFRQNQITKSDFPRGFWKPPLEFAMTLETGESEFNWLPLQ